MARWTVEILNKQGTRIEAKFHNDLKTLSGIVTREQRLNKNPYAETVKVSWEDGRGGNRSYSESINKNDIKKGGK